MDYSERIAAGMAWLDEEQPDWDKFINQDKLNLNLTNKCILGQTFGPGAYHQLAFYKGFGWLQDHGFESDSDEDLMGGQLTQQWREAIQKRRQALIPA
jgi:hypothetical protein